MALFPGGHSASITNHRFPVFPHFHIFLIRSRKKQVKPMLEAINLGISIVIALLVYAFSKRRVSAIAAHTLLCLVFVFSIDGYLSGWQLPTGPELLNTILIVGLLALMVGVLKQ